MSMSYKIKTILICFVSVLLVITGCGSSDRFHGDRPYDSYFDTAKEFAEYWCGPCEEVDEYTVETSYGDVIIHKMQDTEFGFVYSVEERVEEYTTGVYSDYSTNDFSYYYLQTYLECADLENIIDEYSLTVDIDEISESATEGLTGFYMPGVDIYTDLLLSDSECDLILDSFVDEFEAFDVRGNFTREYDNAVVFFHLYSAPTAEEQQNGYYHHSEDRTYGYQQ